MPITHRLNPETGLYDRTPEFKALMSKLTDEERWLLVRAGLTMTAEPPPVFQLKDTTNADK